MSEENVIVEEVKTGQSQSKICFMCETDEAKFCIKGKPNDCYCKKCAVEAFGDTSYLEKL